MTLTFKGLIIAALLQIGGTLMFIVMDWVRT